MYNTVHDFCSHYYIRVAADKLDRPLSRVHPEVIPLEAKEMKATTLAASRYFVVFFVFSSSLVVVSQHSAQYVTG